MFSLLIVIVLRGLLGSGARVPPPLSFFDMVSLLLRGCFCAVSPPRTRHFNMGSRDFYLHIGNIGVWYLLIVVCSLIAVNFI